MWSCLYCCMFIYMLYVYLYVVCLKLGLRLFIFCFYFIIATLIFLFISIYFLFFYCVPKLCSHTLKTWMTISYANYPWTLFADLILRTQPLLFTFVPFSKSIIFFYCLFYLKVKRQQKNHLPHRILQLHNVFCNFVRFMDFLFYLPENHDYNVGTY